MEQQEPIYPESLRKYTPIIAALGIVLLAVFFFLPKSAASVIHLSPEKTVACCMNTAGSEEVRELSGDEIASLFAFLRDTRLKNSGSSGIPSVDYILTFTASNGKTVNIAVSAEGYLHMDQVSYQIKQGSAELISFLETLPAA